MVNRKITDVFQPRNSTELELKGVVNVYNKYPKPLKWTDDAGPFLNKSPSYLHLRAACKTVSA